MLTGLVQLCLRCESPSFLRVSRFAVQLVQCYGMCNEKSVVLAILMVTHLSLAILILGASMSFTDSSNCCTGCIVPVIGLSLLTGIDESMIRVDCAGKVCLLSVLIVILFGIHFCISSVSAIVYWIFRKSIVRCALSSIVACFQRNANPIIGKEVWFMIMNVSSKV